jgi:ion channel POLLUX/CASTOR
VLQVDRKALLAGSSSSISAVRGGNRVRKGLSLLLVKCPEPSNKGILHQGLFRHPQYTFAVNNLKSTLSELKLKFRYFFDNSLSKRGAFTVWVSLAVVLAALVIAVLAFVLRAVPALTQEIAVGANAFEDFWLSLGKMLSLGTAATWADRLLAIIYWFAGLTVMGSIFAFRAAALAKTIERLKAAPSPILDSGHTLILGWSPRIFTILRELAIANRNVRKPLVVIFANVDRAVMDAEITLRAGDLGNLRVITRKGDTTSPSDLVRANVKGARSVIVLDSDRGGDSMIVSTVLAARSLSNNPDQRFIAEVDDANTAEALTESSAGQVLTVIPKHVISSVTAQPSRQSGIPNVILELLDFDGDEIYFHSAPALIGKSYFEAQLSFNKAAVIGVKSPGQSPSLNPQNDYTIRQGDQLVLIAEDDNRIFFTGLAEEIRRPKSVAVKPVQPKPRNLLVIGWSDMGERVLSKLSAFLPKGSTVDIVSQSRFTEESLGRQTKFGSLVAKHFESHGAFEQLREMVDAKRYDEVLILGYRGENISEAEADGQTLLATMQLTRLFENSLERGSAPRLVAEILDPLKAQLAKTSSVDDLVVSENLAAFLIAQLSENPHLKSIFADLFNPTSGSAVHVHPIENYVPAGKAVSFGNLVAAASSRGETAVGWRLRSDQSGGQQVIINPAKDQSIVPFENDGLIVIGKSL